MDTAIVAASIGGLVALIGTLVVEGYFRPRDFRRREGAENRRWLLQYYLPLKITSVNALHTVASERYLRYKRASTVNIPEALTSFSDEIVQQKTKEQADKFKAEVDAGAVEHAVGAAGLFLDDGAREAAEDFALSFRMHCMLQLDKIAGKNPHPKLIEEATNLQLDEQFRKLRQELERHLNPTVSLPLS